jgi:hypothetical protein
VSEAELQRIQYALWIAVPAVVHPASFSEPFVCICVHSWKKNMSVVSERSRTAANLTRLSSSVAFGEGGLDHRAPLHHRFTLNANDHYILFICGFLISA